MTAATKQADKKPIAKLIFSPNTLICCVLGFSSGLPLFILINLVPLWMREQKVDLSTIGLFSLVMFPYTWKFLWAPFLDAVFFKKLGRRRTWMLATQVPLMAGVALLAFCDPVAQLSATAAICVVVAVLSATQDIVIDAYRREILSDRELGFGNSVHVNFYRLSSLVPGSLALILSDFMPWKPVFLMVAAFMLPGILLTLCVREPSSHSGFKSLKSTIVDPFKDFFSRKGWSGVCVFLGFLFLYKLGDSMATALISPFYYDIGFSKTEIGSMAKIIGTVSTVIGAFAGGIIMMKSGINKALYWFGYVQLVTILGFAWLALAGRDLSVLAVAVTGEYLGVGLGTAAFTAFIARETNPAFAATQFALFTAITAVPRTFCNGITGYMVEFFKDLAGANGLGWCLFFFACTALAIPGMMLVKKVAPQDAIGSKFSEPEDAAAKNVICSQTQGIEGGTDARRKA